MVPLAAAPIEDTDFVGGPENVTLAFQVHGRLNRFTLQKTLGLDAANGTNTGNAYRALGAVIFTFG